jgi:hypothetical protein
MRIDDRMLLRDDRPNGADTGRLRGADYPVNVENEPTTMRKLYLMGPLLEYAARLCKVPCFEGNLGDIRTHFLGRGNVPRDSARAKAMVKNKCRARGWLFQDDNEADALAGLDWALACDSPAFALAGTALFGKVQ